MWTGVKCFSPRASVRGVAILPLSLRSTAALLLSPAASLVSTAMSLPLKSSMMFRSTCASYAGAGRTDCLFFSRLVSEPGVAMPLSFREAREEP